MKKDYNMRITLLLILFVSTFGFAQNNNVETGLNFNKKYYEAVDKWIAFPKKETDTTYTFGFIYIDEEAGFTFDYSSDFIVTENGLKKMPRKFEASLKSRLSENTTDVAILTTKQIKELELPNEPDWLHFYKENENEVSYLKNIGFHYNHIGACKLALIPLNKAYMIEPHYKGLEFELAYAYNALGKFKKAIIVLEKAIENNPKQFYFYRELGFAYKHIGNIDESEKIYLKGIKMSTNDFEKSEMAVNMAQTYFQIRDKKKFKKWAKLTRKYAEKGSQYAQYIDLFESKWDDK